jgi:phosphotransacetylase
MLKPVDKLASSWAEECSKHPHMARMLDAAAALGPLKLAVVHPTDGESLGGALAARDAGMAEPILVGPPHRIEAAAEAARLDIAGLPIIAAPHSHAAAVEAVALVRAGRAEAIMKGNLHTDELLGPIVSGATGLRTERRISHVFVFDVPSYPRPLLITDAAINIYPTLEDKQDIVQNAIELAIAIGIDTPRVAILSAVETINPKIKSTIEAAALCKMADRGQIKGGVVDGPLAFDNAISETAARIKGIKSDVAGHADILVAPDLEAGNMLAKQLEYLADAEGAGLLLGARVPVVLTSRADDAFTRMASCALASLMAKYQRDIAAGRGV